MTNRVTYTIQAQNTFKLNQGALYRF